MEHEFEKTIREKIDRAEQVPALWNKVWVRSRVGLVRERKTFAFYYAAASILLATALFFYGTEQTRQKQLQVRLESIELLIEENRTYQASMEARAESNIEWLACDDSKTTVDAKNIDTPKATHKIELRKTEMPPTQSKEIKEEQSIAQLKIEKSEEPAAPVIVETNPIAILISPVRPIIGGGDQNFLPTTNKVRKFKISLFTQEEEVIPIIPVTEPINFLSKN